MHCTGRESADETAASPSLLFSPSLRTFLIVAVVIFLFSFVPSNASAVSRAIAPPPFFCARAAYMYVYNCARSVLNPRYKKWDDRISEVSPILDPRRRTRRRKSEMRNARPILPTTRLPRVPAPSKRSRSVVREGELYSFFPSLGHSVADPKPGCEKLDLREDIFSREMRARDERGEKLLGE